MLFNLRCISMPAIVTDCMRGHITGRHRQSADFITIALAQLDLLVFTVILACNARTLHKPAFPVCTTVTMADVLAQAQSWGEHVETCAGNSGLKVRMHPGCISFVYCVEVEVERIFAATVQGLLDGGGNANAKEDKTGATALMFSADHGHLDKLKLLLKAGADVNAKNKRGRTALHAAAEQGHEEIIKALLAAGADANVKDKDNVTPAMLAKAWGFKTAAKLIKG